MGKRFISLLLCFFLLFFAHSQSSSPALKDHATHKSSLRAGKQKKSHIGTASFYANKFNGRKTANGDIFSQKKLTAACNIVPLNTFVRVTNLRNHRKIVVKVTDRMHHANKRLIDLSRVAAQKLRYTGWGLTKVKVEIIGPRQPDDWVLEPGLK